MTYSLEIANNPLADDPPVAATQSGGPVESPGLLVKPKNFIYEVSRETNRENCLDSMLTA